MGNPFILKKLAHGVLKKKPNIPVAELRQGFISPLVFGEKYLIKADGSATITLEGGEGILWSNGLGSRAIQMHDQEFIFSFKVPPTGIKISLNSNNQELHSISLREILEMPDEEIIVLEDELIRNHDFLSSSDEYLFFEDSGIKKNKKKIRWVEGYNNYIVREAIE